MKPFHHRRSSGARSRRAIAVLGVVCLWCLTTGPTVAAGDDDLRELPLATRREKLENALRDAAPPIHLSPVTRDRTLAEDWFRRFEGAGLDGVMAKRLDSPYRAGERTMIKVKHSRTADCVVAGLRWHKKGHGTMVGSLLLGRRQHPFTHRPK